VIGHDDSELKREKQKLIASGVVKPGISSSPASSCHLALVEIRIAYG
jgi:hypothetical protein